jgi:hypothetical protein
MFGMHTDGVLEASETEDEPAEGEGRISTVYTRKCMLFLRCFELFKDCSRREQRINTIPSIPPTLPVPSRENGDLAGKGIARLNERSFFAAHHTLPRVSPILPPPTA